MRYLFIAALLILVQIESPGQLNHFLQVNQSPPGGGISGYVVTDSGGIAVSNVKQIVHDSAGNIAEVFSTISSAGDATGFYPFQLGNGYIYSFGTNSSNELIVCKSDQNGTPLICKKYPGTFFPYPEDIAVIDTTRFAVIYGHMLAVFDASCNAVLWETINPDTTVQIAYHELAITDQHEFLLASTNANNGILITKLDSAGRFLWCREYHLGQWFVCHDIQMGYDNSYYIVGETDYGAGWVDVFVLKTDTAGTPVFLKTYGDTLYNARPRLIPLKDSSFILAGTTYMEYNGPSDQNLFISRSDATGNLLWCNTYGMRNDASSTRVEDLLSVTCINDSILIVAASVIYTTVPPPFSAGWIFEENINGSAQNVCGAAVLPFDVNQFSPTFISHPAVVNPDTNVSALIFPIKTVLSGLSTNQCDYVGIAEETHLPEVTVFPNPVGDIVTFTVVDSPEPFKIAIRDAMGRTVRETESSQNSTRVDCSDLAAGLYFYTLLFSSGQSQSGKLIIE